MKRKNVVAVGIIGCCIFMSGCGSDVDVSATNSMDIKNDTTFSGNTSSGNDNASVSGDSNSVNITDNDGDGNVTVSGNSNTITIHKNDTKEVQSRETETTENIESEKSAEEPVENKEFNVTGNTVTAIQGDVTIYVNSVPTVVKDIDGAEISPLIYNGNVYVPVSSLAEILETPVNTDRENNAIYIGRRADGSNNMLDVVKAYDYSNFEQYSFQKSGGVDHFEMASKEYVDGAVFYANYSSPAYASFALDGKYKTLNFKVGHLDGASLIDGILNVFVDGILEAEITVSAVDYPVDYSIDVSNGSHLRLMMYCSDGSNKSSYAMTDMELIPI